ncbi:MAG: hypothetical protein LBV34_12270 [Nocardiopsaceae bacterium]|jgi:hypothetical protein|nr:hypothetical protein [Nocardiopsaceae bacterium]
MADPDETTPLDALTRESKGRRLRLRGWPLALVLVWLGLAVFDIVIVAPFSPATSNQDAQAAGHNGAGHRYASSGGHHHAHTRTPSPSPSAMPSVLEPVSASAFGPTGTGSGDNESSAAAAIDASTVTVWRTQWYASAAFGNLKTGTGLLVDMGRTVKITGVRILMNSAMGADLTLYGGAEPVLADEQVLATSTDVGGNVLLTLARPARARYLVIWFTLLPQDSAGTYRAVIHGIKVKGTTGASG